MKTFVLNPSEKLIWRTAYAQAFVECFANGMAEAGSNPNGFDQTVQRTQAEYAIAVADAAIIRLRQAMQVTKHIGSVIEWPEEWGVI